MSLKSDSKSSSNLSRQNSGQKYTSTTEFITVPSFLLKTYEIVDDPSYNDIVGWNKAGDAFVITKTNDFCEKILPLYFKHKNLSSFVRQLNMYGFHKTKYKNNEQCFTHEYFRKDNKRLLLKMKRKTKEKSSSKRSTQDDSYVKTSDFLKVMGEMRSKIKEQDKKINQLIRVNKEFKNSVLALYTELEKSKERERNGNKILIDISPMFQGKNGVTPNFLEKSAQGAASEGKVSFDSNDVSNMFKGLIENICQKMSMNAPNDRNQQLMGGDNLMIENGKNLSQEKSKECAQSSPQNPARKRDMKGLRSPSPSHDGAWKKVHELRDRSRSPSINLGDHKNWEKEHLFSLDHSIISDFDHLKEKDKGEDQDYLLGNNPLNDFMPPHPEEHEKPLAIMPYEHSDIEVLSKNDKPDPLEIASVSSFSANGDKLCGKKRAAVH